MNLTIHIRLFLLLFIISVTTVFSDSGGSGYSRYWLGDFHYFSTSRAMGMGGASIAVMSTNAIDQVNPAAWGHISSMRFSVSVLYEGYSTTDGVQSAFLGSANFNGFMLAIPIVSQSGIVFGGGITPLSKVNYNIIGPLQLGGLDYTLQYLGRGGLSQAHAGLSASLGNDLSLGAKLNYYFGTLHHTVIQSFSSLQYTDGGVERSTRLNGVGFTFGATYSGLKKFFNLPETNALNVGLVFTTTSYLKAIDQRFFTYTTGSLTTRDTSTSPESKVRMPFALGGGISYLSDRMLLASDLYYQNWSQYDARGINPSEIRDSYRFGAGGEVLPKREALAPFFQRLAYRFGFFYNATYYNIKGEPVNEVGLTGGVGIPVFHETRLNIAAEYSFRGTTNQQLQKDKIFRLSFTLSGGELWFIRNEEE